MTMVLPEITIQMRCRSTGTNRMHSESTVDSLQKASLPEGELGDWGWANLLSPMTICLNNYNNLFSKYKG